MHPRRFDDLRILAFFTFLTLCITVLCITARGHGGILTDQLDTIREFYSSPASDTYAKYYRGPGGENYGFLDNPRIIMSADADPAISTRFSIYFFEFRERLPGVYTEDRIERSDVSSFDIFHYVRDVTPKGLGNTFLRQINLVDYDSDGAVDCGYEMLRVYGSPDASGVCPLLHTSGPTKMSQEKCVEYYKKALKFWTAKIAVGPAPFDKGTPPVIDPTAPKTGI